MLEARLDELVNGKKQREHHANLHKAVMENRLRKVPGGSDKKYPNLERDYQTFKKKYQKQPADPEQFMKYLEDLEKISTPFAPLQN